MALARIRQLVDRLSVKAIFNRLDKRKLQNELDVHRLFLITSHFDKLAAGRELGQHYVGELAAEAQKLGHEGMQSAVEAVLHKQFLHTSTALHNCLRQAADPMPAVKHALLADVRQQQQAEALAAPKSRRPRGLAAAMGASDSRSNPPQIADAPPTATSPTTSSSALNATSTTTPPEPTATTSDSHSVLNTGSVSNNSISNSTSHNTDAAASNVSSSSSGFGKASGSASRSSAAALTISELSSAMQQRLGYSLEVRPSGISHPDAGNGLWLQGTAPVGAMIALYPGLVYEPMHYRKIPGYPKIDTHNDYFLARFDGALIDGQSWGTARPSLGGSSQAVQPTSHSTQSAMLAKLHQKEVRHPFALAHYANHPAAGTPPNVMVAAYTFTPSPGEEAWLAAYMPNVMYHDLNLQPPTESVKHDKQIKGLMFVATRQIQDEEILLNYRLNPQVHKPAWYASVDIEEDTRRWY